MKRLYLISAILLCSVWSIYATDTSYDGGTQPNQGQQIGGKGSDGKFHFFTTDASGNLSVNQGSTSSTTVVSTAFEASHVLKASAGSLITLDGFNSGPAQFILIMNSATVPANGAVTLLYPPIKVNTASNFSLHFNTPLVASTGISISNSSTGTFTKTIGAADCAFVAQVQ